MMKKRRNLKEDMDLSDPQEGTLSKKEKRNRAKILKKEETSEEKYMKIEISEVENSNLKRVFNLFAGLRFPPDDDSKEDGKLRWFDSTDVRRILNKLGVREIREHDISIMIWVNTLSPKMAFFRPRIQF